MNIGKAASHLWDVLTTPQSMGAVLVIVCFQYRSLLLAFVHMAMNDGIMQTLFNLALNIANIMRGYYHMSKEIIRRLSQYRFFPFMNENHDSNYASYSSSPRDDTTNVSDSSHGPLPRLVKVRNGIVCEEEEDVTASQTADSGAAESRDSKSKMVPLEPAFLKKEDYPPGWLIFHPILGISSVQEVDQYEKEQLQKMENVNDASEDTQGTLPSEETG